MDATGSKDVPSLQFPNHQLFTYQVLIHIARQFFSSVSTYVCMLKYCLILKNQILTYHLIYVYNTYELNLKYHSLQKCQMFYWTIFYVKLHLYHTLAIDLLKSC